MSNTAAEILGFLTCCVLASLAFAWLVILPSIGLLWCMGVLCPLCWGRVERLSGPLVELPEVFRETEA